MVLEFKIVVNDSWEKIWGKLKIKICGKLIIVVYFIWIKFLIKKKVIVILIIKYDIENYNRKIDNIFWVEGKFWKGFLL